MDSKEKCQPGRSGNSQGIEENLSFNNIRHEDSRFPANSKELNELKAKYLAEKFPNVPDHARGKAKPYNDRTSGELTKSIKAAIELSGGQCERIANMGRTLDNRYSYTDVLGHSKTIGSVKYIPGTGTNGTADLSATIDGRSIKIEVKIGKDRMSEAQKHYREKVEAAGGIYIVARSFEQFALELGRRLKDG
jgi:hypothetical protein